MNYKYLFSTIGALALCMMIFTGCDEKPADNGDSDSTPGAVDEGSDHSHEDGSDHSHDGDSGHDGDGESDHDDADHDDADHDDADHDDAGHDDAGHDDAGYDDESGHDQEDGDADSGHDEATGHEDGEHGDGAAEANTFSVFDGRIQMSAPGSWVDVEPANNIIEAEFKVPRINEDEVNDGRMTFMSAGGGVQANVDRWFSQFKAPEGGAIASDQSEIEVAERTVHIVDISGTFMESAGGPMGPKTDREKYRMLAAIIEISESTGYFIKFYGPAATVAANEEGFMEMVNSATFDE